MSDYLCAYLSPDYFPAVALTLEEAKIGSIKLKIGTEASVLPEEGDAIEIHVAGREKFQAVVMGEEKGVLTLRDPLDVYVPERTIVNYIYWLGRVHHKTRGETG